MVLRERQEPIFINKHFALCVDMSLAFIAKRSQELVGR
jgi:hypothetical protein